MTAATADRRARPITGVLAIALATWCTTAHADDSVEFERPGIGFSALALAPGQATWEQGLPDVVRNDADGIRNTRYTATSLLRVGLGAGLEIQLGSDSRVWERSRSEDARFSTRGAGDSSVALKWALPGSSESMQWALLAQQGVLTGASDLRAERAQQDLGISVATGDVAFYLNATRDEDGTGWTASPSWTFLSTETVGAYVEAGVGTGSQRSRALGTGVTWRVAPAVQLDLSVLRGFAADEDDWTGGFGVSFLLF